MNTLATITSAVKIQWRISAPTGVLYLLFLAQNSENGRIRIFAISCLTRAFTYVLTKTFPNADSAISTLRPFLTNVPSPKTYYRSVYMLGKECNYSVGENLDEEVRGNGDAFFHKFFGSACGKLSPVSIRGFVNTKRRSYTYATFARM